MSVYEEAVRRAAEQRALAQAANIPDPLMFGLDYADVIEQQIAPVVARQTWRPETDFDQETNFQSIFPAGGFRGPNAVRNTAEPDFTTQLSPLGPVNQQPGIADFKMTEAMPFVAQPASLSTQEDEWRRQNAGRTPALAPASPTAPIEVLSAAGLIPNTAVDAPVVGAMNGPVPPGRDFIEIQDAQTGEIRRTYLNAPSTAVPVAANATEQQRMLAQQGVDLANMTIRRAGTPEIVDGVATFPAYEVPLNRQNVSPDQLSVLQAIGVLPYDDPAAEIARQQANAKSRSEMARAAAEMQAAQNDAAAATRPKLMEVGGVVISVDPTTNAVKPVYSTPAKPDVRLVSQPDGTQLAVDMNAVTPGQTLGTPAARKPTDIVSDDSGAFESEEVRRQVQRFLGQSDVTWDNVRAATSLMFDADSTSGNIFAALDPEEPEHMAAVLSYAVEDPEFLDEAEDDAESITDAAKKAKAKSAITRIRKQLRLENRAGSTSGGNRFLNTGVEEELQ